MVTAPACVVGSVPTASGTVVEAPTSERARKYAQYGKLPELKALLDSGEFGVNERDAEGCTLLQWAAINDRVELVKLLLLRGAEADATGGLLDETAMQWAMRHGHVRPIVLLREAGCGAENRGADGGSAVHLACRYAKTLPLAYLLARDEVPPGKPLGLLELLDERGRTPLMICVEWYWTTPRHALETLRALVAFGASLNFAEETSRRTALHFAAERGLDREALEVMARAGGSLRAEDGEGRTPEAVAQHAGHAATCVALRELRLRYSGASCGGCRGRVGGKKAAGAEPGVVSRCSGVASSSRRRRRDAKKSDDAEEDADDDVESCDVEDDECLLSEAGSDACDRDVLVEHRGWWDAGLARVSRCAARSGCERACWYGLLSPLVGFYCAGEFARRSGWLRGLVMTVVFAAAMTRFAPFGTARWGHCGFALASILAIARSFFQFGFGAQHCADGIAFVYALLVTGLVTSFALAAASDPGVVDLARADRLLRLVELARSGELADARLCASCLLERPERSKHDQTLGKCVRRFDHYCPYVANAVGQRNYKFFVAFLFFVVAALSLHLATVLPKLSLVRGACGDSRESQTSRRSSVHGDPLARGERWCVLSHCNAPLALASFFAVVHLLWVTAMLAMHTSLALTDHTTYEQIKGTPALNGDRNCQTKGCLHGAKANCRASLCSSPPRGDDEPS